MEIEKLIRFNSWWTSKLVRAELLIHNKRPLYNKLLDYMKDRQILLIYGLRRVGKTSLLYQLIQELLNTGIKETSILYFSFDEQLISLDDLIKTYEEKVLKKSLNSEKIYIFLDEIQKSGDWENKIKIYYDLFPNIKFIISGSASVHIKKKMKESLAGRIYDFMLEPLSFEEFLKLKNIKVDKKQINLYNREILPVFYDYLMKGGFPEITNEENEEKIKNYVRNSVIDKILYQDIPSEFKLKDYDLLRTILERVASNPGMIINFETLSKELQRNKNTIMAYFYYLDYALLLRFLANYRGKFSISSRKLKKVYLTNTAISFAFADQINDKLQEKIFENYAIISSNAKNYYRNKIEVDIILKINNKIIPVEVKHGKIEEDSLIYFLNEFSIKEGIILTNERFDKKTINNLEIDYIPLWAFSLFKEDYLK